MGRKSRAVRCCWANVNHWTVRELRLTLATRHTLQATSAAWPLSCAESRLHDLQARVRSPAVHIRASIISAQARPQPKKVPRMPLRLRGRRTSLREASRAKPNAIGGFPHPLLIHLASRQPVVTPPASFVCACRVSTQAIPESAITSRPAPFPFHRSAWFCNVSPTARGTRTLEKKQRRIILNMGFAQAQATHAPCILMRCICHANRSEAA